MTTLTALPRLPSKLREITGSEDVPTYRRCYNMALDGALPTISRNGRLFIQDVDLPRVAAMLGLTITTDRVAA